MILNHGPMLSLYSVWKSPRMMGRGAIFLMHAVGSFSNIGAPDTCTLYTLNGSISNTHFAPFDIESCTPFGQHNNPGMLCLLGVI